MAFFLLLKVLLMPNKLTVELHNQTMNWLADNGGLRVSDRIPTEYPHKLVELAVRRCMQAALDADDVYLAIEMADLFGIPDVFGTPPICESKQ